MNRLLPVVRREYLERVRSKLFVISTLIGPLLVIGLTLVPGLLMQKQRGQAAAGGHPRRDGRAARRRRGEPRPAPGRRRAALRDRARGRRRRRRGPAAPRARTSIAGRIDGFVVLPADVAETSRAEYYGKNVSNVMDISMVDQAIEEALVGHRLTAAGLGAGQGRGAHPQARPEDGPPHRPAAPARTAAEPSSWRWLLLMMLYSTVAMWGAAIMNAVIEEKTNRVVEVIVSSVPPSSLFWGKLLGVGRGGAHPVPLLGVVHGRWSGSTARASSGSLLPEVSPLLLGAFVTYFLLGYFLYAAMYAAVGSAVNNQQEAQSLAFPVMMPLILGVMFSFAMHGQPGQPALGGAVADSVPDPAADVPAHHRAHAAGLADRALGGADARSRSRVLTWLAGRVYRVGILMYGKRPTFPEIVRWARPAEGRRASARYGRRGPVEARGAKGVEVHRDRGPRARPRRGLSPTSGPSRMPLRNSPAAWIQARAAAPVPDDRQAVGRARPQPGPGLRDAARRPARARSRGRWRAPRCSAARGDALVEAGALDRAAGQQAAVPARDQVPAMRAHHVAQQARGEVEGDDVAAHRLDRRRLRGRPAAGPPRPRSRSPPPARETSRRPPTRRPRGRPPRTRLVTGRPHSSAAPRATADAASARTRRTLSTRGRPGRTGPTRTAGFRFGSASRSSSAAERLDGQPARALPGRRARAGPPLPLR